MNKRSWLLSMLPVLLCVACSLAPAPTPSPSPSPTPTAVPAPSPTLAPEGFYLRLWTSQALPAEFTFTSLPSLTITGNTVIDGNVAIPMIYPGPLLISPVARFISNDGIAAIIAEARRLGLLDGPTDFSNGQPMPGAVTAHISIVVDGVDHELTGSADLVSNCSADAHCDAVPGTPPAFSAFWYEATSLVAWLGSQLGASVDYEPDRLAVLLVAPVTAQRPLSPQSRPWPLTAGFANFGVPAGSSRCATVSGSDLGLLLPAVLSANQLTVFVDLTGVRQSLAVRVVVPDEPSPCGDES